MADDSGSDNKKKEDEKKRRSLKNQTKEKEREREREKAKDARKKGEKERKMAGVRSGPTHSHRSSKEKMDAKGEKGERGERGEKLKRPKGPTDSDGSKTVEIIESPLVFVTPPPPMYICPIHQGLFADPVIAGRCGHTFCRRCIERVVNIEPQGDTDTAKCPVDGTDLSLMNIIPNVALAECVGKILVHCRYGLRKRRKGSKIEEHLSQDPDDLLSDIQFDESDVDDWEFDPEGCQEHLPLAQREMHESTCQLRPIRCPYCKKTRVNGKKLLMRDLDEHQKKCDSTPCPHSQFGCPFMGTASQVQAHTNDCDYERVKHVLLHSQQQVTDLEEKMEEKIRNLELSFEKQLEEQRQEHKMALHEITQLREIVSRYVLPGSSRALNGHTDSSLRHVNHPSMKNVTHKRLTHHRHSVESEQLSSAKDTYSATREKSATRDNSIRESSIRDISGTRETRSARENSFRDMSAAGRTDNETFDDQTSEFDRKCLTEKEDPHPSSRSVVALHSSAKADYSHAHEDELPELFMGHARMCFVGSLNGHEGAVWGLARAGGSLIVSGSSDGTVKLWNLKTMACLHSFVGHEGNVHTIAVHQGRIFSGSSDYTIKVWDISSKVCVATLKGHTAIVSSIVISDRHVFSGSYTEIKVWDLESLQCVTTLRGHNHWVRALVIDQGFLYSGSYNSIKVWDLLTLKCVNTIDTPGGSVYCLIVSGNRLFSASYDRKIYVWDIKTMECIKSMHGHLQTVYSLCVSGSLLYSGSYDQKIRVWSLDRLMCLQTLSRHTGSIDALLAVDMPEYDNYIVSASADHKICCWASSTTRVITPHVSP